jgi:hypothetical protein
MLLVIPLRLLGQQSDTLVAAHRYSIVDKYPWYQYCKNCKIESPRPPMACGKKFNVLFAGYSYDKTNWIDIGYNRNVASCYPDLGGYLFSASLTATTQNGKVLNGARISYFRDHLAGLQFYFLMFGCSAEAYTNYKQVDTLIRPEIRIGDNMYFSRLLTRMQVSYGYNIFLSENGTIRRGRHQISVNLRLLIKGWVS